MGKFRLEIEDRAEKDFIKIYKSGDTASIKKIEKHNLSGFWSRRLNKKDWILYQIFEEP